MKLYHITLNNLRRRKAKMLFVLVGLVIGIATMISVYGVVEAMKTEMTRQVTEFGVNVVITPDSGGLTFSYGGIALPEIMYDVERLTAEDVSAVAEIPSNNMIRVTAPKLMGLGELDNGRQVIVTGGDLQQEFLVKPWLRLQDNKMMPPVDQAAKPQESVDPEEGKNMDFVALDLTREDLERLLISDDQVLLGASLAASMGAAEGDVLTLSGKRVEVAAVLTESGSAEDEQILMNLQAAQSLLARPGEITVIEMAVDYFLGSEEVLLSELSEALPHTQITSLRQETLRRDQMLTRLVRFGMSISVLVLLVGTLVVCLTMSGSVRERTREIGVFRALGFRKSHITQMILMEGILISIVGGLIGYAAGVLAARYAGPLLAGMELVVPWRLDLLPPVIGLAILIGTISSLYPAYQAAKQDPVEALRFI